MSWLAGGYRGGGAAFSTFIKTSIFFIALPTRAAALMTASSLLSVSEPLKVCPHNRACPAGTGEHKSKISVLPCPRFEAEQSLYFIVNTGEITTWYSC